MAIYMAESQALQSACEVFGSVCISTFALIAIKTNKWGSAFRSKECVCEHFTVNHKPGSARTTDISDITLCISSSLKNKMYLMLFFIVELSVISQVTTGASSRGI